MTRGFSPPRSPRPDFFEAVLSARAPNGKDSRQTAKAVSNWILGELTRLMNAEGVGITQLKLQPVHILELLDLIDDGTLSSSMAKTVFETVFETGRSPRQIAEADGMAQIVDAQSLRPAVDQAISSNPKPVADYLSGKETAVRFLVGQVMKLTRGKANPNLVSEMVKESLDARR